MPSKEKKSKNSKKYVPPPEEEGETPPPSTQETPPEQNGGGQEEVLDPSIRMRFSFVNNIYQILLLANSRVNWEPEESAQFYQYEIYRVLANESPLNDTSIVAIMENPNMDHFLDRSAGNGTSWKYSIAIVDVCGNKINSDFIIGATRP